MEALMRTLWIAAALCVLTTSADAGQVFNFGINGGTARVEIPRNCRDLACLNLSFTDRNGKQYTTKDLDGLTGKDKDKDSKVTDAPVTSPFGTTVQPAARAPASAPATVTPGNLPARTSVPPPPLAEAKPAPRYEPAREPPRPSMEEQAYDPQPDPNPAPARAPEVASPRQPERVATNRVEPPAPASMPQAALIGPIGEWLVQDGSAQIRIEECGGNLCGYVSQSKTPNDTDHKNPNPKLRHRSIVGTPILLDMKPGKARWDGTIYNPKDGSSYTSHISMRNPNTLRVEGCAFGGLFCGGENWKRVM
jgi:uncharacterized protein (DUF2147 family)